MQPPLKLELIPSAIILQLEQATAIWRALKATNYYCYIKVSASLLYELPTPYYYRY